MTKPFSIQELLARVKSFLRRLHKDDVEMVCFADCEFNRTSCQLKRNGQLIELTPKEYGLLDYVVQNQGRALTRDQILNAVWGSDLVVTERSVDRAVKSLRAKIEENPSRPRLLKTVQKIGYRFEGKLK